MVGRGELGFVMAGEAYANKLTSKLVYAITVWALLVATLISPYAFRKALAEDPRERKGEAKGEAKGVFEPEARAHRDAQSAEMVAVAVGAHPPSHGPAAARGGCGCA